MAAVSEKRKKQYRQLGLTIAYYRKMNGMTQLQLAEAINVSRTHLSNIEAPNMPTSVSLELLFDISDVLEIPIAKLFEFRE
ncbi:MAG: helix-turn-helix transcriptional regulator [Lachnospiraceae bacterium]|nr:helix-turn-helix transcriptional regulator [Clostridiales bacterium]MCD7716337.1 helix-turn-helix transcriptional regulator [Lachnospiraceae bacterium]MCC8105855.1 helix-turn-helix transcriptional regulator [Clostridiales bacterium]MCC8136881.1 helix-turn-helix transcriptional regulator [Clostridiales bacterium]MCD7762528.1 helix-turn-helix transcriptional regulator [Lachnospiraceae bacterium]